ncbi:MAG: hypothetical protein ABW122_04260 [Ilumatobacteraceae bacterium]
MASPGSRDRPSGSPAFYASLPGKHVSAGCLLRDEHGDVLIVKPTYKASWEVPGGFDGGVLDATDLASITLPPDELSEWRLVPVEELGTYVIPAVARRLRACLTGSGAFLEEGVPTVPDRG